jgi:hypothetical protein
MAVEAVHGCVELAAEKPLSMRGFPFEDLTPGVHPLELSGPVGPITFWIFASVFVGPGIAHVRLGFEGSGGREAPLLVEEGFDPFSRHNSGY